MKRRNDIIVAIITDIVISLLVTYFSNNGILICILIVAVLVVTMWIFNLIGKNKKMLEYIDEVEKKCESLQNTISNTRTELSEGKRPTDIIISSFNEQVNNPFASYSSINIDIDIKYAKDNDFLDIEYSWNIYGYNASLKTSLKSIIVAIDGDYPIRNNDDLKLQTYIILRNGESKELAYNIWGDSKMKYLQICFNEYSINPNQPFHIFFSYIWIKSYNVRGDTFSFGKGMKYSMKIKIESDQECFSAANLQTKMINDTENIEEYAPLTVTKASGKSSTTTTIPSANLNLDKAIYIILAP